MSEHFRGYDFGCPICGKNNFRSRRKFHVWNKYYCREHQGVFHKPVRIDNLTGQSKYDQTYDGYHRRDTRATITHRRTSSVSLIRALMVVSVIGVVGFLFYKIGPFAIIVLLMGIALVVTVIRPSKRGRRK